MMKEILRLEHIQKFYGNQGNLTKAISDISFSVNSGEFVGIMGASGSGKTTLLNCISTIDTVSAGHIYLDGADVTEIKEKELSRFRRENLGFVFQDFNLLDNFSLRDNIYLPLVLSNTPKEQMESRIEPLAAQLKISDILEKYPYEVSGGQKQRVAIARALITAPKIVLADEPTGALDSHSSAQVMKLFTDIHRTGQTILVVTHSVKTACYAGRVLFIRDGRLFNQLYRGDMDNEAFQEKISDNLKILLQKEGLDA